MDAFLGELRTFGFGFIPKGWATCNGQLLAINSNQALFSLLGTTYGGNGQTTFGLPDLRGRVAIGFGTLASGPNYTQGQVAGSERVSLTVAQLPAHTHLAFGSTTPVSTGNPGSGVMLGTFPGTQSNYAATAIAGTTALNAAAVANVGSGQTHENRQPLLTLNVCIATQGIFPSRS